MMSSATRLLAAGVLLWAPGACTGGAAAPSGEPTPPPSQPAPADQPSQAELEALYKARTDSARMHFTEADVRFMTDMIAHHAQALSMARLVPDRTDNPEIRILAARIDNAQKDEIATMQRWLRDRDQPAPELHVMGDRVMVHGAGMTSHGAAHGAPHEVAAAMGMLTEEQMRTLEQARSGEFDRLFLTGMIQHHQGAVGMVKKLFATYGAGQDEDVFRFATDVHVDQITEIARMEMMLESLPPADD